MFIKIVTSLMMSFPLLAAATTPWDFNEIRPYVVAALGDSISVGTNAKNLGVNLDYSWITGSAIKSHKTKILEIVEQAEFHNFAVNGADIENIISVQLPHVLALDNLDYLTILVGANDLCHWNVYNYDSDILRFHQVLNQGLQRVFNKFPNVTVLMLTPPNLVNLKKLKTNRCQVVWNITNICPSLLRSQVTVDETSKFEMMMGDLNSTLSKMPKSSLYGDLRFNDVLFRSSFEKKDVSGIDCFHPSALGQQRISDEAFNSLR